MKIGDISKRLWRTYSGSKQKATGFACLQGSPYHDPEGSFEPILCLNYAVINASPRIWTKIDKNKL